MPKVRLWNPDSPVFAQPSREEVEKVYGSTGDVDLRPIPGDPANYSNAVSAAEFRAALRTAFSRDDRTLDNTTFERVWAAWRITREMARVRRIVLADEFLADIDQDSLSEDPWTSPQPTPEPMGGSVSGVWTNARKTRAAMYAAEDLPVEVYPDPERRGVALVPPDPKDPHADPEDDELLAAFIAVARAAADTLGISEGISMMASRGRQHDNREDEMARFDPEVGIVALGLLLNPRTCRIAWPSRFQIVTFESMLIERALHIRAEHPPKEFKRILREDYGLSTLEITQVEKLTTVLAVESMDHSPEEQQALMMLRLEGFVARAREAMDLRAELGAIKQMCTVLRLSAHPPKSEFEMIENILLEAAKDRKEARKAFGSAQTGAQGEIIDADARVLPERQ